MARRHKPKADQHPLYFTIRLNARERAALRREAYRRACSMGAVIRDGIRLITAKNNGPGGRNPEAGPSTQRSGATPCLPLT